MNILLKYEVTQGACSEGALLMGQEAAQEWEQPDPI